MKLLLALVVSLAPWGCDGPSEDPAPAEVPTAAEADPGSVPALAPRSSNRAEAPATEVPPAPPDATDSFERQDVTMSARALDDGRYPEPPSGVGRSSATPRSKRAPRTEEHSAGRFTLRMPDPLPLPTPTVHRDKVLIGTGLWFGAIRRDGTLVWARETTDMGPSSAACEGDLCAFSTYSCTVIVAEADTGEVRSNSWLGPTVLSAPAVDGGVVYAAFEASVTRATATGDLASGGLAALDLASGDLRWRRWLDRDVIGAPVVGSSLYLATWGGTFYSIDKDSGAVRSARAAYLAGPPSLRGDRLQSSHLRLDGDWYAELRDEPALPPPLVGEEHAWQVRLLASRASPRGADQRGWLYPDARGRGPWPLEAVDRWPAPSVVSRNVASPYSHYNLFQGWSPVQSGDVTAAVLGNELVATRGGRVIWSYDLSDTYDRAALEPYLTKRAGDFRRGYAPSLRGFPPAALSASPSRVVATTLDGRALVFDATSGEHLQTLTIGHPVATQVALARGWLYAGTLDGRLVAIDSGDPALDGWSSHGGNRRRDGHPAPGV